MSKKGNNAILFSTDSQNPVSSSGVGEILHEDGAGYGWYQKAREIRTDPTVALARAILGAPIIKNEWRVQGSDSRAVSVLQDALLPIRSAIMRSAVNSGIDYGWQSWEVRPQRVNGFAYCRIKPLRHERTEIILNSQGFPHMLRNTPDAGDISEEVELEDPYFAITAAGEEYGNPTGYPLLKNAEKIMQRYDEVEESVSRHIKKVAGSHWALWFPTGHSEVKGESIDNSDIAQRILNSLRASGEVAMPVDSDDFREMMMGGSSGGSSSGRKSAWDLELIESKSGIDPFLERQQYLDALKMRALFVPERTALEGQFGTKAESSEHADIAMLVIEQWGNGILEWVNSPYGFVGSILKFNNVKWYPGCAQVVPLPLADDDKHFMRELLRTIMNGNETYSRVVDLKALGERSNVPMVENIEEVLKDAIADQRTALDKKSKLAEENPKELKDGQNDD